MTQEQKAFIERVGNLAAADMQKSGVLASLTIAQAILESEWGKSGLTVKANALFGIKAGTNWKGRVYSTKTQECYDGVNFTTVTALFRAYNSWEESVENHSALLTGATRYKAVVGERDYKTACRTIKAAGYATNPNYADKLIQLIESYSLTAYDGAGQARAGGGSNITAGAERPADAKGEGKMKASEFINKLQNIVDNYKTLYVMGCFGAPLTGGNVSRYCTNHSYNKQAARTAMIKAAANKNPPVFGFDCVCMIKGVLWGWNGDASKTYGGASYASGGVPDIGADTMITKCSGVSTNFSKIVPGGSRVDERSYRRLHRRWKGDRVFLGVQELRAGDGVSEYRSDLRHERAQVGEAWQIAVYHLRQHRRGHRRRRNGAEAQLGLCCLRRTGVRRGRRGALYGQPALHKRERGERESLQARKGESYGDFKGCKAPLPPDQAERRRVNGLRLGQRGRRAERGGRGN